MSGETDTDQLPVEEQGLASDDGSTSAEQTVYTAEQIAKLKSDAAAEAGRRRKAAEDERDAAKQQLQEMKDRLEQLEKAEHEAKLNELKENPDELQSYKARTEIKAKERELLMKERELAKKESELSERLSAIENEARESKLTSVLTKHGIGKDDVKDLGIDDPDVLDKILTKFKPSVEAEKDESSFGFEFTPDPGNSIGGSGSLTVKAAERMSVDQLKEKLLKR